MSSEALTGLTESHLSNVLIGQKHFLIHSDIQRDLLALYSAACEAGFNFHIASGFRSFERQKTIWNNKFRGISPILSKESQPLDPDSLSEIEKVNAILRWSALPGGSRHHWGTDFDIYDRDAIAQGETLQLEPWEYLSGIKPLFISG